MNKINLFLDSGAFSAWTQGIEIDIYEYINFIKEHQDIIEVYANLDTIAKTDSLSDRKEAAEKTFQNQKIMEDAGLSPLPVFHIGEPFKYLQHYTDNYDYIALGGMVGKFKNILIPWLDKCFGQFICDEKGMPKTKAHGFGLTSLFLMRRYPWYSVDSTSWLVVGRFGSIYVPQYRKGEWVYDENSWNIAVSSKSPSKKEAGQHIETLPPKQKEIVLQYIKEKGYELGKSRFKKMPQTYEPKENESWAEKKSKDKTVKRLLEIIEEEGICNNYKLRHEINIIYFQDLEKVLPKWPRPFEQTGFRGFDI